MTFPNNSVIAASGWNKQNIYLSIQKLISVIQTWKELGRIKLYYISPFSLLTTSRKHR